MILAPDSHFGKIGRLGPQTKRAKMGFKYAKLTVFDRKGPFLAKKPKHVLTLFCVSSE